MAQIIRLPTRAREKQPTTIQGGASLQSGGEGNLQFRNEVGYSLGNEAAYSLWNEIAYSLGNEVDHSLGEKAHSLEEKVVSGTEGV